MKVLYVTSEAQPFAASGGLADVAGSLPQSLRQRLIGCRIVMPLYESTASKFSDCMKFIGSISVPVAWRRQYCGVFEARSGGVIYYLIDNQYYFKRNDLYGFFDDAERFAFFSRAALEILPLIDFKPDILHANDWQTALVPIFFDLYYSKSEWYQNMKTVFTIHNIQYQGKYGLEISEDVFGISESDLSVVEFDKCINLMKGAIETSNKVTTVSPSYANEILDPWFSHGLDPILKDREWKLSGILNGIDTIKFNPATDENIYENYDEDTFAIGKAKNKKQLQERLFLPQNPDVPLIGLVSRLVSHKGLDLIKYSFDELLSKNDVQVVVLGTGDWEYESYFKDLQSRYPDRMVSCSGYITELAMKIYAASDMFLMPSKSEPCGLSQMISLRYGSIPIVRETGGLRDSIRDSGDGEGNGFTFKSYNYRDMLGAINRALKGYSDREGWNVLVKRAMLCDNGWGKSANEYIKLYKSIH